MIKQAIAKVSKFYSKTLQIFIKNHFWSIGIDYFRVFKNLKRVRDRYGERQLRQKSGQIMKKLHKK